MTLDNGLSYDTHVLHLCKKVNAQLNATIRLSKLISRDTKLKLYKAFILPHFRYCSSVWHFCGASNSYKLEYLNRRVFRFVLNDKDSSYTQLLEKAGTVSLYSNSANMFYDDKVKALHYDNYPNYIKEILTLCRSNYALRGTNILQLCKPDTTIYSQNAFLQIFCLKDMELQS